MQKARCVLLIALFFALPIAAQTVRGRVTTEGSPLPGVTVAIDELGLSTITDAQGQYALTLPANRKGTAKITASLQGFAAKSASVDTSGNATQDFALRPSFGQEITVGSRAINAEQEKAVPIDIIPREQIDTTPSTETNQIIQKVAPSFNFPRPSISDGTDSVRPATLRGLGPDQVLVMVNGKRRHTSALVNVNGTVGRGSSGADLNAIPASAIDSVEILRDGAAAQYGSDAIAGVLNLVMRSDASPLRIEVKGGATTHGDGQMLDTNLSGGWKVGHGALFATFEYRDRYETNRALDDPRDQVKPGDAHNNAVEQPNTHWGDAYERDLMGLVNLNVPVSEDGKQIFYGFGAVGLRHGQHGGNYRRAMDATNWPQIYPLGFLPLIEPRIADQSINAGMRGEMANWFYDASAGYGHNKIDFQITNTLNASLGPNSTQRSFNAGSLADRLYTVNFDVSRAFNIGLAGPANVAGGVEYRRDGYQVIAGEEGSYIDGGSLNQFGTARAAPGSQVFPGFRPSNEIDTDRSSKAIYVDTEADVLPQFRVGLAGRFEDFSDFGNTTNGKLTLRYSPMKPLIFRAATSTGFRAPSLSQSWFSSVATNFIRSTVTGNVEPFEVWTAPVSSPIAVALGATPLRPENSRNYSGGVVWQPMSNLEMTADFFHIDLAAAYSNNKTEITAIAPTPPQLAGLGAVLFDRGEQRRTTCGQPRDNIRLMEGYNQGPLNLTLRQSRYGEYCSATIQPIDDQTYGAKWLADLDLSYRWGKYVFGIGAENLFDAFPDRNLRAGTPSGSAQVGGAGVFLYPNNSPFGMNGRFVYTRVNYTF